MKRKHETPQNALADIALLLLIFFLITTQFPKEDGIRTTLPSLNAIPATNQVTEVEVWLNGNDQIMVESQPVAIESLSDHLATILMRPDHETRVNLKSHVGSSYAAYVSVYDQIKRAYSILYDDLAETTFGKPFASLSATEQNIIKSAHPVRVFEGDLVQ